MHNFRKKISSISSSFSIRFYFASARDLNIRHTSNRLISDLKRVIYDPSFNSGSKGDLENRVLQCLGKAEPSEILAAAASISRINRRGGGIMDARVSVPILERLCRTVQVFDRGDLIQLIQICSLSVNRRKVLLQDSGAASVERITCKLIRLCCIELNGRLEDLPVSSLSVLVSALSRRFIAGVEGCFEDAVLTVSKHIEACLNRPDTPASAIIREDLQRVVPFVLLACGQNHVQARMELLESSLALFSKYLNEASFTSLSMLIEGISGSPDSLFCEDSRFKRVLSHCGNCIEISPEDFTIADMCRMLVKVKREESFMNTVLRHLEYAAASRSTSEWSLHVIVEVAEILSITSPTSTTHLRDRFGREFACKAPDLPPMYACRIFCALLKSSVDESIKVRSTSLVIENMKKLTPDSLHQLLDGISATGTSEKVHLQHVYMSACKQLRRFRNSPTPANSDRLEDFSKSLLSCNL